MRHSALAQVTVMSGPRRISGLLAILFCSWAHHTPATGQSIPIDALRDWMWYSERGEADVVRGDYARAATRFIQAIHQIEAYPRTNRRLLARSYCDLAEALYHQNRFAEAEPLAKWALTVRDADKNSSPDAHFDCLFTLGAIHSEQKHYSDAAPLFERALALQERQLPVGHVNTLFTLSRLATAYTELGKYRQAESMYLRVLAIHERKTPDENPDLAEAAENYAALLRRMDRAPEAQQWLERAAGIRDHVATKRARAAADAARSQLRGFK
jgi:tetratricopeptide (TPR) repeat protein